MPVTPFHFGPGAALAVLARRRVSFVTFCAANVLIDVESLYNLVTGGFPVHAFFHSYIGATLAGIAAVFAVRLARSIARRWELSNLFGWFDETNASLVAGALIGAWSHVVLDSVMHADIAPFAPFSAANGLYRIVPVDVLHGFCAASAVLALALFGWREWRRSDT